MIGKCRKKLKVVKQDIISLDVKVIHWTARQSDKEIMMTKDKET